MVATIISQCKPTAAPDNSSVQSTSTSQTSRPVSLTGCTLELGDQTNVFSGWATTSGRLGTIEGTMVNTQSVSMQTGRFYVSSSDGQQFAVRNDQGEFKNYSGIWIDSTDAGMNECISTALDKILSAGDQARQQAYAQNAAKQQEEMLRSVAQDIDKNQTIYTCVNNQLALKRENVMVYSGAATNRVLSQRADLSFEDYAKLRMIPLVGEPESKRIGSGELSNSTLLESRLYFQDSVLLQVTQGSTLHYRNEGNQILLALSDVQCADTGTTAAQAFDELGKRCNPKGSSVRSYPLENLNSMTGNIVTNKNERNNGSSAIKKDGIIIRGNLGGKNTFYKVEISRKDSAPFEAYVRKNEVTCKEHWDM